MPVSAVMKLAYYDAHCDRCLQIVGITWFKLCTKELDCMQVAADYFFFACNLYAAGSHRLLQVTRRFSCAPLPYWAQGKYMKSQSNYLIVYIKSLLLMNVCSSLISVVNRSLRVSDCIVVCHVSGIQWMILAVFSGRSEFFMPFTSRAFRFLSVLELSMVGTVDILHSITVVFSWCLVSLSMSAVEGSLTGMAVTKLGVPCFVECGLIIMVCYKVPMLLGS